MTGKELAKLLGVSEATVSYALNKRPGVSARMRNRILEAAQEHGLSFKEKETPQGGSRTIYMLYCQKGETNIAQNEFGSEVGLGVEIACRKRGYPVHILHIRDREAFQIQLKEISNLEGSGIIVLGTELTPDELPDLAFASAPLVLLDNHFNTYSFDSVEINNEESAFNAVNYLIKKRHSKPGHLKSLLYLHNFEKREAGFKNALVHNGYSKSSYISHGITPEVTSAYQDMLGVIDSGEELASCYFADNDFIAIGAMRALQERGYRIPEDIGIIGFDDVYLTDFTSPGLTTVHVPKKYMGIIAAERLFVRFESQDVYPVNIQVSTNLVGRGSI